MTDWNHKSTVAEIRSRFDNDVERFSNLETGQQATMDAPVVLTRVAKVAAHHLRPGASILDIGCGAGNFTLRVMGETGPLHCHLADLSQPMLDRASDRVRAAGAAGISTHQADLRDLEFAPESFDAIVAGAVLHHLRGDDDWERVFRKLHEWLKPGGRLYVSDLIWFDDPHVQDLMWQQYGEYLVALRGEGYRDAVFAYIDKEDSPRPLNYQLELLRQSGFSSFEVLHRNSVFAAYYGQK
ncbi:MAG TPA: methyltransferase domain-containing protein [Chthoniobacterales bacterium]